MSTNYNLNRMRKLAGLTEGNLNEGGFGSDGYTGDWQAEKDRSGGENLKEVDDLYDAFKKANREINAAIYQLCAEYGVDDTDDLSRHDSQFDEIFAKYYALVDALKEYHPSGYSHR